MPCRGLWTLSAQTRGWRLGSDKGPGAPTCAGSSGGEGRDSLWSPQLSATTTPGRFETQWTASALAGAPQGTPSGIFQAHLKHSPLRCHAVSLPDLCPLGETHRAIRPGAPGLALGGEALCLLGLSELGLRVRSKGLEVTLVLAESVAWEGFP